MNGNNIYREAAFYIVDEFDDLLALHDIYIPDIEREGEPDEAPIYGCTYYNLVDKVETYLEDTFGKQTTLFV